MHKNIIIRSLIITAVLFFATNGAMAKRAVKKVSRTKNGQLMKSINEAMDRSTEDQKIIRKQVDFETQDNINAWDERSSGVIEIKHTGSSSYDTPNLGKHDLSLEEEGEDHSGLSGLRSNVEEESTDINFDEELREVSSLKDLRTEGS